MRKNIVIFGLITVLFLSVIGCSPAAPSVPEGSIPVREMLAGLNGRQLNILEVVEYHESWIAVEINGTPMTLTPDSKQMENTIYWLTPKTYANNAPAFGRMNLFDTELWDWMKEEDPEMVYYVFANDFGLIDDRTAAGLVLARTEDVNWVSAAKWDGTQSTIVTWEYPVISPLVVHNMDTNEDAFMAVVFAEDDKGNVFDLGQGQAVWGYVRFLPSQGVGMGGIKIYESVK